MESEASENVFTKNNNKLLNVAKMADILFWIGVVVIPIMCITTTLQYNVPDLPQKFNIFEHFFSNPTFGLQYISQIFNIIFKGFVVILILKGISLGLRMIVETDVNYRLSGGDK